MLQEMSEKITSAHLNKTRENDSHDLLQDVIVYLYDMNQDRIEQMVERKQISFFIARMMIQQYQSCSSPFYKKYKAPRTYYSLSENYKKKEDKETITKKLEDEKKFKWIEKNLNELPWFDVQAFAIYFKDSHSFTTMARATKISKNTLYRAVRNVKDHLKSKIHKEKTCNKYSSRCSVITKRRTLCKNRTNCKDGRCKSHKGKCYIYN